MSTISVKELAALVERGEAVDLIDVREAFEFRSVHAAPARSVPLSTLDAKGVLAARTGAGAAKPLYVICQSGARSAQACEKLRAAGGGATIVNVEGGTSAWVQAGLPVVRGKKALTVDRQVRIIIGSAVLAGVGLAWAGHAWGLALAGFFGAGLVWAGVTDTCALALLVARLPWNQGAAATAVACAPGGASLAGRG